MKPLLRNGEFSECPLVEVLDGYCQTGQTAAVAIRVPRAGGVDATGAFFLESGALVDARFDGREGAEAVRHALKAPLGRFQVELGARTSRRTVHDSWASLSAQLDIGTRLTAHALPHGNGTAADAPACAAAPNDAPASARRHRLPSSIAAHAERRAPRSSESDGPARAHWRSGRRDIRRYAGSGPPLPSAGDHRTAAPPYLGAGHLSLQRSSHPTQRPPVRSDICQRPQTAGKRYLPRRRHSLAVRGAGRGPVRGHGHALQPFRTHRGTQSRGPAERAGGRPAAPVTVAGVSEKQVTLGMAAPLTGVSKELGRQMRVGLEVAFARANAAGGVNGRKLNLIALDDGYEPARTHDVMRELAEQKGVFSFVGNVGTPTAAVAVPYALERKMLFFGPFTGASLLRKEPPDRYVFNYRASYAEETAAIVRYLVEVRHIKPEQIAVFAQDDSYGDAGFQGVARVIRQLKRTPSSILKVTYTRNTADVSDAVARILDRKVNVAAVVMVATYRPAARFIEKVREQRPNMIFTNVSFVGSQALAEELVQLGPQYAQGVIITQVVPLPTGQSTVGMRYREALAKYAPEEKADFISLEGFVTGTLLIEGLKLAGRNLTTDGLVDALENIHGLDLGLGVPLSFGLSQHQASHKVWGTVLDGTGNFQNLDLE